MKDFNSDGVITISDYKELFLAIPNGLWKQLVNSDIGRFLELSIDSSILTFINIAFTIFVIYLIFLFVRMIPGFIAGIFVYFIKFLKTFFLLKELPSNIFRFSGLNIRYQLGFLTFLYALSIIYTGLYGPIFVLPKDSYLLLFLRILFLNLTWILPFVYLMFRIKYKKAEDDEDSTRFNVLLGYISFSLFGINALIITPDYL